MAVEWLLQPLNMCYLKDTVAIEMILRLASLSSRYHACMCRYIGCHYHQANPSNSTLWLEQIAIESIEQYKCMDNNIQWPVMLCDVILQHVTIESFAKQIHYCMEMVTQGSCKEKSYIIIVLGQNTIKNPFASAQIHNS